MTSLGLHSSEICSVCSDSYGLTTCDDEQRRYDSRVASTDETVVAAVLWCNDCFRLLCESCSKGHRVFCPSHRTVTLNASSAGAAAAAAAEKYFAAAGGITGPLAALHRCSDHGRESEFFCSSCDDGLRCDRCIDDCLEGQHSVAAVDSQSVRDTAKHAAEDLARAAEQLRRKMADVADAATAGKSGSASGGRLEAVLSAALRDDDARVWRGTSTALSAITGAYDRTEAALRDAYDSLFNRVPAAMPENAVRLRAGLSRAAAYVSILLDSGDSASLLDQQHAVRSCLRRLADSADALPPLTADAVQGGSNTNAAAPWTLLHSEVPNRNFATIVQPFVGTVRSPPSPVPPTDASDADVAAAVTKPPCGIQPKKNENETVEMAPSIATRDADQHSGDGGTSYAGKEGAAAAAAAPSALLFGPATTTFRSASASHDVAATPDGRILLAALSEGLKQYDATGRKLTTWRPPQDDIATERGLVSSVDTLADGRVVVAVINARCVHLLRTDPSDGIWIDLHQYDLWLWPYRVAAAASSSGADDSCLAVVGAGVEQPNGKTTQFGPGRDLVVMLLTSDRRDRRNGSTLLERKLDYLANAVTLLGGRDVVVVTGELLSGGKHVVEAYRYGTGANDEAALWRYEIGADVGDLCAAPPSVADAATGLVYMAIPDRRHVQWLDAGTGKKTGVALIAARGSSSPNRLSFSGEVQGLQLVVLAARGFVTVHPLR